MNIAHHRTKWLLFISLGMGFSGSACLNLGTSPNNPTGSSGMGGSGASAEGGGGMGMSAGGNGGHANDPCAGLPTQNVIYVHGLDGDDAAGTGACEKPFKTIKKAHSVAASLGTATTIHLAGALPPIVYSAQTNGEDAEIQLMAPGLTLEGEGMDKTIISGGGLCAPISTMSNCAVLLTAPLSLIRNVHLTSTLGVTLRSTAPLLRLENVIISDGVNNSGLFAQGDVDAYLTNVRVENNGSPGILFSNTGTQSLTMNNCTITSNAGDGLRMEGSGTVISNNNAFLGNKGAGILVQNDVALTSTGDTFELNANGLILGSIGITNEIVIDGAKIQKNLNHGIQILNVKSFKLRNSVVLGNAKYGLDTALDDTIVDLGRMGDLGGNTFQSSNINTKNVGAGVCYSGMGTLSAYGNNWSSCPPKGTTNMPCGGGTDFGTTLGSFNASGPCTPMLRSPGSPL
ncbi:MAG TPA: right-handed parallel beta-helix repeat-containing protein [Polyangium sp.]|nr:right-handed parallel beta-helix repeat-containing protein [Polyangium sp.]